MQIDARITRIMSKMKQLSSKTISYPCGKFPPEWEPVATEQQVTGFEKMYGISLPEDYRRFITTVANGGTQPFYGLRGLLSKDINYEFVDKKFPYTILSPLKIFNMGESEYDEFWDKADDQEYLHGYIPLCEEGCGMKSILIVNTDDKDTYGTVWFWDLANDFGIMPIMHPETERPMSFLDWLEYYVDRSLALDEDEFLSYGELAFPKLKNFRVFGVSDAIQVLGADIAQDESLKLYELLEAEKQSILSKLQKFTLEDLWYSQYYWFLVIMKERNAWNQVDYEQQKYKILESMDLEIEIDWTLIEQLEEIV